MKRNRKGQLQVGSIVMIAVLIIVSVVLLVAIFAEQNKLTDLQSSTDESNALSTSCMVDIGGAIGFSVNESNSACNISINAYSTGDTRFNYTECLPSSVVVGNATLDFAVNTDYKVFADLGIIQMLNATKTQTGYANTTLVDYNYCDIGYNRDSGSRSMAGLIGLFAVIALMLVVAWKAGLFEWFN